MVACDPVARLRAKLRISNPLYVNLLSEFYGTALLLVRLLLVLGRCPATVIWVLRVLARRQATVPRDSFRDLTMDRLQVLGLAIVMQFILTSEKMNTWINVRIR